MIKRARFDGDAFYAALDGERQGSPMHLEASSRGKRGQRLYSDPNLSRQAPGRGQPCCVAGLVWPGCGQVRQR